MHKTFSFWFSQLHPFLHMILCNGSLGIMVVWRLCARSSCNENLVAGLRCEKMKPNPACNGTIELNPTMSARPHVLPCCFLSQASTLVATFGKGNGPNPQPMIHLFLILPFRNCLRTDLQCPKSQMHLQASKQSAISWSGVSLSVLCVCVCVFSLLPWFQSESLILHSHIRTEVFLLSQQMNKLCVSLGWFWNFFAKTNLGCNCCLCKSGRIFGLFVRQWRCSTPWRWRSLKGGLVRERLSSLEPLVARAWKPRSSLLKVKKQLFSPTAQLPKICLSPKTSQLLHVGLSRQPAWCQLPSGFGYDWSILVSC